jgi:hypothetical protein
VLGLARDLREARLSLAERDSEVERLTGELSRLRDTVDDQVRQGGRAEVARFLTGIGTPVAQLVSQDGLHRAGIEVRGADVLDVGMRLVRQLCDEGAELLGTVGATEPFDADRHEPLSLSAALGVGEPVVVRMVGLALHGTVLRKAGVEVAGTVA